MKSDFLNSYKQKIRNANINDPDSKLGAYLQVNPDLITPPSDNNMIEIERIHITRLRSGPHNLAIETIRFTAPRVPRELRLCKCGNSIQTLHHVLLQCNTILNSENINTFENNFTQVSEFFNWPKLHEYMLSISNTLKIEL